MTEPFQFTPNKIADHMTKVGVDVRPVVEPKLDRDKLYNIGFQLVEKYPNLFENLVQSPSEFRITKNFIFPGKGEAELITFSITQRGFVLSFPHVVSIFEEEITLNNLDDVAIYCLDVFKKFFPEKNIIRVGLVNIYIYDTGKLESVRLITERFTKITASSEGEIRLRINRRTDDYNRIIDIQALRKLEQIQEMPDRLQTEGYAVKVTVDFNNREMDKDLSNSRILGILHDGRQYNENELYQYLNGSFGEE